MSVENKKYLAQFLLQIQIKECNFNCKQKWKSQQYDHINQLQGKPILRFKYALQPSLPSLSACSLGGSWKERGDRGDGRTPPLQTQAHPNRFPALSLKQQQLKLRGNNPNSSDLDTKPSLWTDRRASCSSRLTARNGNLIRK